MSSANQDKKLYRSIGHKLNPVVIVKTFSDGVRAEIDRALKDHELIKIKVITSEREDKKSLIAEICETLGAELVQQTGHVALILRRAPKPNPALSNLLRHR